MPRGIPNKKVVYLGAIYVAKDSFTTTLDGTPVSVSRGITTAREGHPIILGREDLWEPLRVDYEVNPQQVDDVEPEDDGGDRPTFRPAA